MPIAPVSPMVSYQKGRGVLSQYAHEGFSGVVAIPPPGRQVAALASKRKFAAKNHGVTASCPIYVYCLGAHHLGRDIILPGDRPPVNVLRKGGRSPFERTGLSSEHMASRNVLA